jgi:hypothetical protein
VLIGRTDIEKVGGKQGANMTGDHFLRERFAARAIKYSTLIQENQSEHNGDCCRQG